MLEILAYLLKRYVNSGVELWLNYESLTIELEQHGFSSEAIHDAFSWIETIICYDRETYAKIQSSSTRVFNSVEYNKLGSESCGFLYFLVQCKTIDSAMRELIIDRAMALPTHVVTFEQFKWVVTLAMLNGKIDEAIMARAMQSRDQVMAAGYRYC